MGPINLLALDHSPVISSAPVNASVAAPFIIPPVPINGIPAPAFPPFTSISFIEIFTSYIPTLPYVPRAAQTDVLRLLTSLVNAATTEIGYIRLMAFPKAVLYRPTVPLKSRGLTLRIKADITIFLETADGPSILLRRNLLLFPQTSVGPDVPFVVDDSSSSEIPSSASIRRCKHFVNCGLIGPSFRALQALPPAQPCLSTLRQLRVLHPPDPYPSSVFPVFNDSTSAPNVITAERVNRMFFKASAASSAGTDGLHPWIIKDLLRHTDDSLVTALSTAIGAFGNRISSGNIPDSVRPFWCSARLIALVKNADVANSHSSASLRPLAISNSWRRAFAIDFNHSVLLPALDSVISPNQFGVKSGGAEVIIHAVRSLYSSLPFISGSTILASAPSLPIPVFRTAHLKVDIKNAFQMMRRHTIAAWLHRISPSAVPYFLLHYRNNFPLYFFNELLVSQCGVLQGSSESSTAFMAGFNDFLISFAAAFPSLSLNAWLFDDGNLIGDVSTLRLAFLYLQEHLPSIGLELNLSKCEIGWSFDPISPADSSGYHAYLHSIFPELAVPGRLPLPLGIFPATGSIVLGSFIGTPAAFDIFWLSKLQSVKTLLSRVSRLDDSQCQILFLRHCISFSKIMHLLRTTPSFPAAASFDDLLRSFLDSYLLSSMSDSEYTRASFPLRYGGLGLLSASVISPIAYLCSRIAANASLSAALSLPPARCFEDLLVSYPPAVTAAYLPSSIADEALSPEPTAHLCRDKSLLIRGKA